MAKKAKSGARREAIPASELDDNRLAAEAAGCTFYIGKPCDKDPTHGSVRYTNTGQCKECTRSYFRNNHQDRYARSKAKAGAKASAKLLQSDPDAFTYVAFTLGSVEGIRRWRESVTRKLGVSHG